MQGAKQEVKVAGSCARCRVGVTKVGRKVVFDWFSPAYRIFGRWAKAETTGLSHGEPPDIRPAGADPLVTG